MPGSDSPVTASQTDRGQAERGSAEREERDPIRKLALLPARFIGVLVELPACRRPTVRAEPSVFLRGEFHLSLVPVVEYRGKPHEQGGQADGKRDAEHDHQYERPSR